MVDFPEGEGTGDGGMIGMISEGNKTGPRRVQEARQDRVSIESPASTRQEADFPSELNGWVEDSPC